MFIVIVTNIKYILDWFFILIIVLIRVFLKHIILLLINDVANLFKLNIYSTINQNM